MEVVENAFRPFGLSHEPLSFREHDEDVRDQLGLHYLPHSDDSDEDDD